MLAVGRVFGCEPEKLLRTAAGIEMIHTYSLIHDDLPAMDDDDLRRGRSTCHKKFDEATAILAGDVLQTLAFQAVAEDETLSPAIRVRVIAEISRAAGKMVEGQTLDLTAESRKIEGGELENIHLRKTGALIRAAARCACVIAEAEESEIETISEYASLLGLLFQITDDLLDVTAKSEALGKTPGKDAQAEKATYISLYGIERTREMAQKIHAEICGKLEMPKREAHLLKEIADYVLLRRY